MSTMFETFQKGDILEIKYLVWRPIEGGDDVVSRWIRAEVIACESETWPLARLADGQVTEIRPFMKCRHIVAAPRRADIDFAA